MKVITLTAENVKRLKAVETHPDEHVQIIGGRNAQGKTSVMDALWLAIGGGTAAKGTKAPIRDGEDHASVTLDLGDLTVTRTWKGDKTALTVAAADGAKYSSPQGILDALVGRLSFDPLEFTRLSAREQVAALLDLVDLGIDLDDLARKRATLYDERTEIGRQGRSLGTAEQLFPGVPDAEVSLSALVAELNAATEAERHRSNVSAREAEAARKAADIESRISALKTELTDARAWLDRVRIEAADLPVAADVEEIRARMETVEDTNVRVRRNRTAREVKARGDALHGQYDALTTQIDALDETKAKALAAAKFPVDGLAFDESGVTYQGIPFSQASAAEQIRVSLAMAMALNPKLRVIRILDGSLLDADNLALIGEMAREHDYQVWIERVGDADKGAVIIDDGAVA